MSKCTNCGKEINYLKHYQSGENYYDLVFIDGSHKYGNIRFVPDDRVCDYNCPVCNATLFTDESEAIAFLEETEL